MDDEDAWQKTLARLNAQLNRDVFEKINLPRFRDIEMPTSYGDLTGFLPGDYRGPYGGLPTFGSLGQSAQMFGFTGNDPRWQQMGYAANTPTMGMRSLYHQLENFTQQMNEAQRQDVLNRQQSDLEAQMTYGGGPVLQGQQVAPWLAPHIEWAREFVRNNEGRMPTQQDLALTLARQGRKIEDYAYPGNPGGTQGPLAGQMQAQGAGGYGAGGAPSAADYYGQAMSPAQRALIEQGRQFNVTAALQALQQESQLRADPFQLAAYRSGLSRAGMPGIIGAVAGSGVLPGVQGGQTAAPDRPTLQNQVNQTAGQPTFGQQSLGAAQPVPGMADLERQIQAAGPLSQINARNYARMGPGGQQYVNSLYRYSGEAQSDEDVQDIVRRQLPQFARRGTPTFGRIA